jgi:hypothetical protein
MIKKILTLIFVLSYASAVYAAGWYQDVKNPTLAWLYRQRISVNSSSIDATLTDFPVMVKIADKTNPVFSKALSTGYDILFTNADGTSKISHEVEFINTTNGTLFAWVRVPSVSNTVNTDIYMYYGCSLATTQETKTGVWDSNFALVSHLSETSGNHKDSTSNANNATFTNVSTQGSTVGMADGADNMSGNATYVKYSTTGISTASGTVSLWVKTFTSAGLSGYTYFFSQQYAANNRYAMAQYNGVYRINYKNSAFTSTSFTIPLNEWHFYVITWEGNSCVAWADGNPVGVVTATVAGNISSEVYIGKYAAGLQQYLTGEVDEFRVSKTTRPPEWIRAEYRNQLSTSGFYNIYAEERRPSVLIVDKDVRKYVN